MPSYDNHHVRHHPHGGDGAVPQQLQPPPPKPNQKVLSLILKAIIMTVITTLFFLFLGVAAILLLVATAALHRHSNPSSPANRLSRKDLKKLSQFRYSRKAMPDGEIECVVCLEGIKHGQWCRKLFRCGHVFHRRCVDAWLVKVSACPICRSEVRLDSGAALGERPLWGFGYTNELRVW